MAEERVQRSEPQSASAMRWRSAAPLMLVMRRRRIRWWPGSIKKEGQASLKPVAPRPDRLDPFEGDRQAILAAAVVAGPRGGEYDARQREQDRGDAKEGRRLRRHSCCLPCAVPMQRKSSRRITSIKGAR